MSSNPFPLFRPVQEKAGYFSPGKFLGNHGAINKYLMRPPKYIGFSILSGSILHFARKFGDESFRRLSDQEIAKYAYKDLPYKTESIPATAGGISLLKDVVLLWLDSDKLFEERNAAIRSLGQLAAIPPHIEWREADAASIVLGRFGENISLNSKVRAAQALNERFEGQKLLFGTPPPP